MSAQSCSTLRTHGLCPPGSSVHGTSRQEYWSGFPFPTPGDLPNPGTEPESLASPALAGGFFFCCWPPGKPLYTNKVKVLVTQSCLTLYHPVECSPPGSSVHGILWAGILEWVAMPFSRGSSQPRDQTWVSRICRQNLDQLSHNESPSKEVFVEYLLYTKNCSITLHLWL